MQVLNSTTPSDSAILNMPMASADLSLLKWRARRGLLENDIILERFFKKHEANLTHVQGLALTYILNLTDRILMDVFMQKQTLTLELLDLDEETLNNIKQDSNMQNAIFKTLEMLQTS